MQCRYCMETIQDGAIKCKHCGSMLSNSEAILPLTQFNISQSICNMTNKVDNTLVWTLAFAPILGAILEQALKSSFGSLWIFSLATMVLNIVLAIFDEMKLKQQGYDTSALGNAWLIPVYLYKRAKQFNQNLSYLIVWIVCFVLLFI